MKPYLPLLIVCAALAAPTAWAGHPLVTETADALARGTCEVEFVRANEKGGTAPKVGHSDVQFSCGAGARSQLAIGVDSSRVDGLRAEGYRVAGKTTLLAPEDGNTGFGVRYSLGWATTQGKRTELESTTVLAVATREIRNGVIAHANLGFTRDRLQSRSTGLWSLGVESTDPISWAADIFGEESSKPSVSLGLGWRAGKDVFVSVAYAMQTADEKARSLSLGLKLLF
jgi:hypothetical protein